VHTLLLRVLEKYPTEKKSTKGESTLIQPYNKSKQEVKMQLLNLDLKIKEKEELVEQLKLKADKLKPLQVEVHELREENLKCLQYIRELEKDKDGLVQNNSFRCLSLHQVPSFIHIT
jgi:FtsZ-binding cell division protein ZapB